MILEFEHFKFKADEGQKPLRIDKFLNNLIPNISRTKIQDTIKNGKVFVNNIVSNSNYKVKPGDEISFRMEYPKREIELIAENIPLNIVFEDDTLIVINKQSNLVVHPSYGNYSGTLVNAILYHLNNKSNFEKNDIRPGLVHRLDKNTTGLMVIAKTEFAKQHLSNQFSERTSKRTYYALVWGNLKDDEGTITGNVARDLRNRKIMNVFEDEEIGKEAITNYKVIKRFGLTTLVSCKLQTGRTHQIRVHFKYIKHPLFNDEEYGGNIILKGVETPKYKQFIHNCFKILNRQALHAKTLGFIHPITQKEMFFESELPEDFTTILTRWENYSKSYL